MNNIDHLKWRKLNGEALSRPLKETIEQTILKEKKAGNNLKVCIGTDSQVYSKIAEFATAIVFLREGKGGFMFINSRSTENKYSIKERLLTEVYHSIEVAYGICDLLDKYKIELEVHADINTQPQFKSNPALSEAMGYILSMGFIFKAKPEAFASSSCANKVV